MKKTLLFMFGGMLMVSTSWSQILQPANASFENWQTYPGSISNTYTEPVDWNTANECSEILNQLSVTGSADAFAGDSSARLETLPAFGNIKINGVLTTATMICSANSGGQEGGTPYTAEVPDSIVGWYKYAPVNNDSAYAQIMFLANNDQDTISYTRVNFTQAVSEWTRFSTPLSPAGVGLSPEKLSLLFNSSWGDGSVGQAEIGSVFFIDTVHFTSGPQGVRDLVNNTDWNVYPNPVVDRLNISNTSGETAYIEILDVTGKQVKYARLNGKNSTVDLSSLVSGAYLYQIRRLDGQALRTGKLFVNH